jgi:hypothetical protein
MLDIRIPIGLMFSLLGAILAVYGWATNSSDIYQKTSLGRNVNLGWGCILLAFGIFMLMLAYISSQRSKGRDGPK